VETTLFDRIGGTGAVKAAVDVFYAKVLADGRIAHFFDGIDIKAQRAKQLAFLIMAFGGPRAYSGVDMRRAHAQLVHNGLNDRHFDAVVENLAATLKELGVGAREIAEVADIAESVRDDVLGREPAQAA
jgi:hemoglobin